ncbi:hypothetical protein BC628DRAFT_60432 [Trametes gibbosa]|nr:hypothetical protein BC628DRAFT_60432 [Trametes gibbosa]
MNCRHMRWVRCTPWRVELQAAIRPRPISGGLPRHVNFIVGKLRPNADLGQNLGQATAEYCAHHRNLGPRTGQDGISPAVPVADRYFLAGAAVLMSSTRPPMHTQPAKPPVSVFVLYAERRFVGARKDGKVCTLYCGDRVASREWWRVDGTSATRRFSCNGKARGARSADIDSRAHPLSPLGEVKQLALDAPGPLPIPDTLHATAGVGQGQLDAILVADAPSLLPYCCMRRWLADTPAMTMRWRGATSSGLRHPQRSSG